MRRTSRVTTGLFLAVALLGAGCGDDDDDAGGTTETTQTGEVSGGEFSMALTEPDSLLPANSTSTHGGQVITALFTGLVEYDRETAAPRNAMATDIATTDSKTWTVKIDDGWTFHDGEAVTAKSYVDAWNFAAYAPNANGNSFFFDKIEGYEALQGDPDATPPVPPSAKEMTGLKVVDETSFTITLTEPFSQLPLTLGYHAFFPMPAAGLADPKTFNEAPVGNGPFQMDGTWRHDEGIRVERYADYAGEPAGADAVEFRIISGEDTGFREFQGDSLDIATSVPIAEVDAARTEYGDRFVERKSSAFNYLGFPVTNAKFAKPELRQAISMAIDREGIIKAIHKGTKEPAHSVIAPLVPGSRPDACGFCDLDPARAKDLLAKAGGWKGPMRLWFTSGRDLEPTMEAIANQLRDNLGIADVVFEPLPFAELRSKIVAREVDGPFLFNWLMDYPSPQSYLEPLYASKSASNRTGYASAEFDRLVAQGNQAATLEAAIKGYQEAENVVLTDMPVAPLWFGLTQAVHSERLSNVHIDPFSRIVVADVSVKG